MRESKALMFPLWVEAIIVIVLGVMAVVEFRHDQFIWSGIFGLGGLLYAVSVFARLKKGSDHA